MNLVELPTEKASYLEAVNRWHTNPDTASSEYAASPGYRQHHPLKVTEADTTLADWKPDLTRSKFETLKPCTMGGKFHQSSLMPSDDASSNVDLSSWQRRHPHHWSSADVLNLIYYVAEQCRSVDLVQLKGENFQDISGNILCSMSTEDFVKRDPQHGKILHGCIQQLLEKCQFIPPEEMMLSIKEELPSAYLDDCYTLSIPDPVRKFSLDDEFISLKESCLRSPAMVTINNYVYDIDSSTEFENIHLDNVLSTLTTDESSYVCDSTEQALLRYEKTEPPYPCQQFYSDLSYNSYKDYSYSNPVDLTWTPYDHEVPQDFSTRPHPNCNQKIYRKRGRPAGTRKEKVEKLSDEEYAHQPDSTSGKLQGSNKGKHLWEFICQLLKKSEGMGKDRIIQWESREEGVFRIINSKEVAKLWGKHKHSTRMTFEKLSRALRWCRSSGFMSALPKEGKYPKKLCFRFGPRATNWRSLGL